MRLTAVEVIVLVAVAGAGWWVWSSWGDNGGTEFSGDIAPFLVEPAEALPTVDEFQRRGRVLVLDTDNVRLDSIHDLLPEDVRARTVDEVGTVGLVTCKETFSAYYILFLIKGYNHECRVRLMAWPSRALLADMGTVLTPPARIRIPLWNRHAPRPNLHLATLIAELPEPGAVR